MHLLIPLVASVAFVCALICVNRLTNAEDGLTSLTILFFSNLGLAAACSGFFAFGGNWNLDLWWQPVIIAVGIVFGLALTFAAVRLGDVSVATPVFGLKVIFVPLLLLFIFGVALPTAIWVSAAMATTGIALIQWTGGKASNSGEAAHSDWRRSGLTIAMAAGASATYAAVDVSLQTWTPLWGVGRLLPLVFWTVGLLSLPMIPWVEWRRLHQRSILVWLVPAVVLTMTQVVCITFTLSVFGDATRVNVVYSLRGLWSVGLAWAAAKIWGGSEAHLSPVQWARRGGGAALLTAAVVLAIAI